tara:strand:+ start:282 stop:386 length:105 start_codon:yes stop_codon:yes gene_type:complete
VSLEEFMNLPPTDLLSRTAAPFDKNLNPLDLPPA